MTAAHRPRLLSSSPAQALVPHPLPGSAPALSARHEQFCQRYVTDPNAARAASAVGYSPRTARQQGSRLLGREDIAARIRVLQAGLAKRSCCHADALMVKLETIYLRALENHQFHAAGRAVEMQARLSGLFAKNSHADDDNC